MELLSTSREEGRCLRRVSFPTDQGKHMRFDEHGYAVADIGYCASTQCSPSFLSSSLVAMDSVDGVDGVDVSCKCP
jgi:hypothetical protein